MMQIRRLTKTFDLIEPQATEIDRLNELQRKTNVIIAMGIGRQLADAQLKLASYGDGVFNKWISERLKIGKTTAYKMLKAFQVFGDCSQCAQTFDISALYLLSQDGTPKPVIEEAFSVANSGRKVTHKHAKWLMEKFQEKQAMEDRKEWSEMKQASKAQGKRWPEPKETDKRCPLSTMQKLWLRTSQHERESFLKWVEMRKVDTELDPGTGRRTTTERNRWRKSEPSCTVSYAHKRRRTSARDMAEKRRELRDRLSQTIDPRFFEYQD